MLPTVLPMLAVSAQPFDSPDHLFEVKWDGVRALAAVEAGRWRLWGRGRADYTDRYPELDVLRRLPSGTLVDGEVVVLRDGRADLPSLFRRHQRTASDPPPAGRRCAPVQYIVFDVLYAQGRPLLHEPLVQRRRLLADLLRAVDDPVLAFSEGIVARGQDFFAQVVAQGHEGVMAKHLRGRYRPGQRSAAWQKIKPRQVLPCVVIGYTPSASGFHTLLVAAAQDGTLRYVGAVAAGFRATDRAAVMPQLRGRLRAGPVVPCAQRARWVEPEVYCLVQFQQWTDRGHLRGAAFRRWLSANAAPAPDPGAIAL